MHRSYVPKTWIDSFIENNQLALPSDVKARFFSVLRIGPFEEIAVFDGCGREVRGYLVQKNGEACFDKAHMIEEPVNSPAIVVIQSALDEKKLSETIKRGCEFGVDRFIIFNAERSDSFVFKKLQSKQERFSRIAEDACRQSGRLYIPSIEFLASLKDVITRKSVDGVGVFGDVIAKKTLSQLLPEKFSNAKQFYIVVGPEGGLSEKECSMLNAAGFFGATWSPFTLRSELASLAAVSIINAFLGRA